MVLFVPAGMREEIIPETRTLICNLGSDYHGVSLGDERIWNWASPHSKRFSIPMDRFGVESHAISVKCLWESIKIFHHTENVKRVKGGDYFMKKKDWIYGHLRIALGDVPNISAKEVGYWSSEDEKIITDFTRARREIYLPIYWEQIRRSIRIPSVRKMLAGIEEKYDTVYIKDHRVGYSLDSENELSPAYILCHYLSGSSIDDVT